MKKTSKLIYNNSFRTALKKKMDEYVHAIYKLSNDFPKEEVYGSKSQIRRAALSVILNYIEGFARRKQAVQLNFYEISYGSLRESRYLLHFSYIEKWISKNQYDNGINQSDEIGAMLWTDIKNLEKRIN